MIAGERERGDERAGQRMFGCTVDGRATIGVRNDGYERATERGLVERMCGRRRITMEV